MEDDDKDHTLMLMPISIIRGEYMLTSRGSSMGEEQKSKNHCLHIVSLTLRKKIW